MQISFSFEQQEECSVGLRSALHGACVSVTLTPFIRKQSRARETGARTRMNRTVRRALNMAKVAKEADIVFSSF